MHALFRFRPFRLLVTCLLLLPSGTLVAQSSPADFCGTPDYDTFLQSLSPQERRMQEQIEAQMRSYVSKTQDVSGDPLWQAHRYDTVRYVIPCVVHVVHRPNTTGQDSVPMTRILRQMHYGLNRDMRAMPGTVGFGHKAVDTQVEFCLATIDPDGEPTTGVVYHASSEFSTVTINSTQAMKAAINWDQTRYFNIWVPYNIDFGGSNVLGFARFPFAGQNSNDGVVVQHSNFAADGDFSGRAYGRTMTHEIGHWLNLFHTFQSGCGSAACQSSGDFVCDTPPELEPVYGFCNNRLNRCDRDVPDLPENNKNYMGYLDDLGMNHFTRGQRIRIHSALDNTLFIQRHNLWQDANLLATGTGKYKTPDWVDFVPSHNSTCPGQPVTFYDYSMGKPHAWEWTFPTADPGYTTSNERTPTVVFSTPGSHSATLRVTNQTGSRDTTLHHMVTVRDVTPTPLPYEQSFENAQPVDYYICNPDSGSPERRAIGALSWARTMLGAAEGNASMRMRNSVYCEYHARDGLVLPPLDMTDAGQAEASIAFSWTYMPFFRSNPPSALPLLYTDSLAVLASTDCGHTWERVHQMGGIDMSVGSFTADPDAGLNVYGNVWRRDTISLNDFLGTSELQIKLESINGYGNDIYVDDIRIDYVAGKAGTLPTQTEAARPAPLHSLPYARFGPNPLRDMGILHLDLPTAQQVQVELRNLEGALLQQLPPQRHAAGNTQVALDLSTYPRGIYLVQVRTDDGQRTFKAVKP